MPPERDAGSCDCTLAKLRSNHPGDAAFAQWMQRAPQNMEAMMAELSSAQSQCLTALEPSSAVAP